MGEEEHRQMGELKNTFSEALEAFDTIDTSGDGLISQREWENIKTQPKVRASLARLGVEENQMEERLNQMQETLFGSRKSVQELKREEEKSGSQHGGLSFDDFVDKVVD